MKVVKSISFNDKNEVEAQMLKIFKRRSFSKYVKQLIIADMEAKKEAKQAEENPQRRPTPHTQTWSPNQKPVFRGTGGIKLNFGGDA
jgi:hypothetical protein